MRLKALELQGFKSFPDKTVITFDRGITVVVGPNGSGKSNIADAMRWVLGEMSSKNIRGGKMEDVVFAGSQKRSPMGYAEVSVTFDNSEDGGKIASLAEYDEFTVTRRYYRIGDSEYFINRKPVRLRDIHELFLNTGLGKDGYSIIGQGKIAEIISQKNEERRAIFEEAAGIAKYRYQKNEAQKKLENTDENLVRIEDIASVLEERVGPLEKEADKAKTYLALREEKMTLDVSLSVYDIQTAKATTDELSGRLLLAKEELESADEARASFESAEEKAREEDMQNKITTEKLSARLLSLTSSLHENESKIKLCEKDAAHLRETVIDAKERIRASEENLKLSEEEYQKLCEEREKAEKNRENLTKEAETLKQSMEKTEDALSANAGFSAVCEARMEELRREQTDAFVAASVAEAKKEADLKRTAEIAQSIEKLEGDIRFFDTRIETAEHKIADLTAKENAIKEKLDTLDRERLQNEKDQREMGEKKNAFFLDISQRKHKIQNLVRMEELLEGYSGSVRFLVNEHKEGRVRLPDGRPVTVYGPVSKLISVPDEYSAALEIAFGQSLQNIVVEDEESAKAAIAHLKKKNAGRATFYPVSTMRGNEVSENEIPQKCKEGFVAVASALVSCDDKFRGIIRSLLGRILIAKDIDHATKIAKAMNFRYRIVTLDGQVINAGGSFTGGSLSQDGRMLSRRVQIEKLTEEVKALEIEHLRAEKTLRTLSASHEDLKKRENAVRSSASGLKTLHDAEQTQLAILRSNRDAQASTLAGLKTEHEALLSATDLAKTSLGDMDKRKTESEAELREMEKKLTALRAERADLSEILEKAKEKQTHLSVEIAKEESHLAMLLQMAETSERRISELKQAINTLHESVHTSETRIREMRTEISEIRKSSEMLTKDLQNAEAEKKTLAQKTESLAKQLSELRIKNRDLSDKRDLLYRTYTKLEGEHNAQRERQDKLVAFLWDEYELSYSEAVKRVKTPVTKENRSAMLIEQTKYKNLIKALGNVNVNAIEEYKEVRRQFDELTAQIDDLKKSKDSLLRIIDSLEDNMRRDFLATVEAINIHFGRVFAQLFGGGHAELKLSDPQNVLESGVDINVAPPGKVIKNMSLLSGGEQAFVAIALYFAILEVNPSPFCILDEIEAALDEVNVDKFADYIKKYSEKTQFVIITHRRGTMEAAERLYGVAMHEKGISDVISIDVSEIEQKIGIQFN